jgi:hypothetical protein
MTPSSLLKKHLLIALLMLSLFVPISAVEASFGITPPYVRNTSLTRNSIYEQQILLVRGNPNVALNAQIVIDAPGLENWIEIVEGNTILLPRGEQKIPMTVRVTVPPDAAFRDYEGKIRIRTVAANDQVTEGVVSISLGAQVDINLTVIDRVIKDFRVRRIGLSDLNEGHKFGWLYFPGKIQFQMLIENTGNVDVAPSRVAFKIYDRVGAVLLEETSHRGKISKVAPYATKEVIAAIPTKLPAGNYLVRYEIFNGNEIKQQGELNMNILPYGTLQQAGFGFTGLSIAHKLSILLPVFALIILILFIIYHITLRRQKYK